MGKLLQKQKQQPQGKVGELTEVTAEEKTGFTVKPITQQEIKADGSTEVVVEYIRNTYTVRYNTNGGSYIPAKSGKYEETVEIYSEAAGESVLTCGIEEHTHTEKPSRDGSWNENVGCWTWYGGNNWGRWNQTCGKTEHTHSDACYTSSGATYNPLPTKQGYTFGGWYADEACTISAPSTASSQKHNCFCLSYTGRGRMESPR